jgi:hypothetical protein
MSAMFPEGPDLRRVDARRDVDAACDQARHTARLGFRNAVVLKVARLPDDGHAGSYELYLIIAQHFHVREARVRPHHSKFGEAHQSVLAEPPIVVGDLGRIEVLMLVEDTPFASASRFAATSRSSETEPDPCTATWA